MSPTAWFTMFAVAGLIWGGFATLLMLALRREAAKARQ